MKSILLTFFVVLLTVNIFSQTPSSCEGEPEIEQAYQLDAEVLALEHIYENELPAMDSVLIPEGISDAIRGALIAVYNVEGIPERDSVVSIYDLHTFPLYILNAVLVSADSNVTWMQELSDGIFPTSEPLLNEMMINYELSVANIFTLGSSFLIELESEQNYNVIALSNLFEAVPDVTFAEPNGYVGDGNNIEVAVTDEYIALDYSLGWGDCPAGCICRRHWVFHVYSDCSVEFINSFGCSIEPVGIAENNADLISIYPNPFDDRIIFEEIENGSEYVLYNQFGQLVDQGRVRDHQITNLESMASGVYFLGIQYDQFTLFKKVLKK